MGSRLFFVERPSADDDCEAPDPLEHSNLTLSELFRLEKTAFSVVYLQTSAGRMRDATARCREPEIQEPLLNIVKSFSRFGSIVLLAGETCLH
jgi:hypothetical protein